MNDSEMTPLQIAEYSYGKLIESHLIIFDKWAEIIEAIDQGTISAWEGAKRFSQFIAPKVQIILLLNELRKYQVVSEDMMVEEFKRQLDDIPETDEPGEK